ncbi:MAG: hypothetical protein H7246_22235 [Phycisphaerae bacterium]|nr:hypothetical protein [Saprospiraceae bacterium]
MKNNIEKTKAPKMLLVDVIGIIIFFALIQIPLREEVLLNQNLIKADSKTNQSSPAVNDSAKTKVHLQP